MTDERETLRVTPGPTALPPSVREAMSREIQNPDVEAEFADFYRSLLSKLGEVYRTDDDVLALAGEGMLGLEASVASLLEPGEEVLCLANGLFGEGFADLVETHGGEPIVHSVPSDRGFDLDPIEDLLAEHDFTAATMVHCETPTGLLNDFDDALAAFDDAGVLSIVDAVSSLGGAPVPAENIDVCLGASQKCFSSPPGLTTLSVSDAAWDKIEETEQSSFYLSLEPWRDIDLAEGEPVFLPYTHSVSNLYALEASIDLLLDEGLENVYDRHESVAAFCRERGRELGLSPHPTSEGLCSPTVTAFEVDGSATALRRRLEDEHGVVLATGLGEHEDDILRVGHMGYNADRDRVASAMDALDAALGE